MSGVPAELAAIPHLDYASFRQAAQDEYHGACPRCGGKDRFVIWTDRQFPSWNWMCRKCHPEHGWIDELAPKLMVPLTQDQKRQFAQEHAQREQVRQEETRKALERFTTDQLWEELHRRMNDQNRAWWRARGVPDDWQDYLQLGYMPDKVIRHDGALFHTPAYTIPYLRKDGNPVTMQYRLIDPPEPKDKYRFEAGLSVSWYETEPYDNLSDQVIITEGAIKSIVTRVLGGFKETVSILAVPGKTSWAGIIEHVTECGRVWVILDPDGKPEAHKLAQQIGKNARVVELPTKIDDALVLGTMTADELHNYFRMARK